MDAPLNAEAHRHGRRIHSHAHGGPHRHVTALRRSQPLHRRHPDRDRELHPIPDHDHGHHHDDHGVGHGHSHGLIDQSIKRSRSGIRAVALSLGVLAATAVAQTIVLAASGSLALLADVIHNFGDALTAVPLGIAFALRSQLAERRAGLMVVAAIFISACVVTAEAVNRLIHPSAPNHLVLLALAGAIGYAGNLFAARIRLTAGERLSSAALIADGNHARADAYVSLAVIASAALVAVGLPVADPLIGLVITLVILRITRQSWSTVRGSERTTDTGHVG
jgi:Co/Zn/Cd efflux system component